MEEKIRAQVERLNGVLQEMNAPYRVDFVDPSKLKLLEKNARYMTQEMFQNLVANIKRDGGLTSLPLCVKEEDAYKVLSGNHRVQAAAAAGVEHIMVLYIEGEVDRQRQVAIQLSHNAIEGKDDPVVLKELWEEIEDIDLKLYAGLDSELLKELEKMEFTSIVEARPDFKTVVLFFLPEEQEELKKLLEDIDLWLTGDEHYLLSVNHYEEVFRLVTDVKKEYKIVNTPTAFMKIFEMAKEKLNI